jgi:hypothetical protein
MTEAFPAAVTPYLPLIIVHIAAAGPEKAAGMA